MGVSSSGFGAMLFGGLRVVCMYTCSNPHLHHHSSTFEIEGLVKTFRAMKGFLLNKQFVVYIDNWFVLQVLRGQSRQDPVLRKLEELMHWYPNIQFVAMKENSLADYLSRFFVYKSKQREVLVLVELSHEIKHMPTVGDSGHMDERVLHVWRFLTTGNRPTKLSSYAL